MNDLLGFSSLFVVSAAVFGPWAGWFAARRRRRPVTWLILGAVLGPIALMLLAVAPPGRCVVCDAAVRGWPARCDTCGLAFGANERAEIATPAVEPYTSALGAPAVVQLPTPEAAPPRPRLVLPEPAEAPVRPRAVRLRAVLPRVARVRHAPAEPPASHARMDAGEVIATGVYFGGTAGLVVGSRYAVVRHGSILRLMGPLDRDPSVVATECALDRMTATAIDDRLVVSDSNMNGLAFALGGLAGATARQLETALTDETSDWRRAVR